MEYEIRSIVDEELEAYRRCLARAFHNDFDSQRMAESRPLFEFDRNLAAFDGGEIVGTAGAFSAEMSVPGGGSLPVAAVTMVSVRPTHRRRGVAAGLMQQQLAQFRELGEPLAALWATESSIYGRFGYGVATQREHLSIPRAYARMRPDLPEPPGSVRLLTMAEAEGILPALHERLRREQPGELARAEKWWDIRVFRDDPAWRVGFAASEYVLYEDESGPQGYARYRAKAGWQDANPDGTLAVQEMYARTAEARVALWRYLLGVDLISTVEQEVAEVDAPLLAMIGDHRRVHRRTYDAIWIRVIDVEQALSGRALATEGGVRFELHAGDGIGGRFQLEGGLGGAVCRRTTAEPEFELGPEELAHVYLGGGSLFQLHAAGRVRGDTRAIARADAMLGWFQPPHCQEHF